MSLAALQQGMLLALVVLAVLTFVSGLFTVNPYGRYMAPDQRFTMPAKPAWLLFEFPQLWAFAATFWAMAGQLSAPAITLFVLWQVHYIYRALIYPLRAHKAGRRFPVSGVVFGFAFNAANGFVNGYAVAHASHLLTSQWFADPRFIAGLTVALTGWAINFQADNILVNLRADGSGGYRIPRGGAFRWISGANYFGEIVLWCGWALMSWTLAGLVFALFTIANLAPRALSHHRWYRETFPDYPRDRRAILPGLL